MRQHASTHFVQIPYKRCWDSRPAPLNVLPLVNKALAMFQWKSDVVIAEKLCREALDIDPECDAAIATLSQLTLQQGRLADACELFERHSKIVRTEAELEQTVSFMLVRVR